ncbi:MAG: rod shape-determining protein MreD [Candidatus Tectimicrobiota bacterium]
MFGVLYAGAVLLALLLETSPLLFTVGSGARLDLILLIVVYISLFWGGERAFVLGFVAGLCQDALSSEVLGLQALSKSVVAFMVQALCRNVQVQSLIAQVLFTGMAVMVDTAVRYLVLLVFQLQTLAVGMVLSTVSRQMLGSLLLAPVLYRALQTLVQKGHIRQEKGQRHGTL